MPLILFRHLPVALRRLSGSVRGWRLWFVGHLPSSSEVFPEGSSLCILASAEPDAVPGEAKSVKPRSSRVMVAVE